MRQVWLNIHGFWSDVIAENDLFIAAKDIDGMITYVIKDGAELTRVAA